MRLFTALWPPEDAVRHLARVVDRLPVDRLDEATAGLRRFRFVDPRRWHLTLCFHGDDADQDVLAERLDRRVARLLRAGSVSPRLRLADAGVFRGVLWIGVRPETGDDDAALRALVGAAGGDPRGYRAHLTIARWVGGRPHRGLPGLFDGYAGPWWQVGELALVRSDLGRSGPEYRTVHRAAVTRETSG